MLKKSTLVWVLPLLLIGIASCENNRGYNDKGPCKMENQGMQKRNNSYRNSKSGNPHNSNGNGACRTCKAPVYSNFNEDCCRVCPPRRKYSCRCKEERKPCPPKRQCPCPTREGNWNCPKDESTRCPCN